jgi:diguanylate cyclase (GGDEF)-like protein/PAS domain S-box-containing protein
MPKPDTSRSEGNGETAQSQVDRLLAAVARLEAEFRDHLNAEQALLTERDLLRAVLKQTPDFQYAKDLGSRFITVNQTVATFNGFSHPDEMIGKTDFDITTAAQAQELFAAEQKIMQSGLPLIDFEELLVGVSGAQTWFATSKAPLRNESGDIVGLAGVTRDITARKHAELLLEEQALVLELIALNAPLEEVLNRLVRLMETQLEGVYGSILLLDETGTHLKHGAAPSLPAAYSRAIDGVAIGPDVGSCGTAAYRREAVIVTDVACDPLWKNFRVLAMHHGLRSCWSTPILSHHGAVLGTFAMYSADVREPGPAETRLTEMTTRIAAIAIERKQSEDQISFMAHHDTLTGLPNRSLLNDRLAQAMLQTQRHNPWVSVVFVDLDNFKTVNDNLGHAAGDVLLKTVATRMLVCVKATDTVMRLGGDEFVILLVDQPENPDAVSAILNKIRTAVAEPVPFEGEAFHVTCSMGVATFPHDGSDVETLLRNADAAMYKAKEAGRDSFQFYMPEMNTKVHQRFALQEAMRNGIARCEFYLLYQPQIDLISGRVFAVEALLRWKHPTLGVISPMEFIPLAEETGLIVPLGDWVLHEACRQNKAWQDAGIPPVNVCVNVSARQFSEKNWIGHVTRALAETGLDAKYLELEMTESLLMRDVDLAIATMKELQALGVQFAIDDFGTGYSSLSALKNLPVARLKIDQSFVRNLADDENDRSITAAVISLGQKLNMRVIAEGVETDEQLAFLRESRCDEIQGYHFSKPIEPAAIEDLLKRQ